jgi:outer membrane autotransporter protein
MTATQSAIYTPLYTVSGATVTQALEQLAPTVYGDALMVARDNWYLIAGAISEQLEARRGTRIGDNTQTASGPRGSTIWLTGLGQFGDVRSNGTAGYSSTTGGVVTGIDFPITPALTLGAAIGFTHQSIAAKNAASFTGDALQFEVYGSFRQGIAFLDMQGGGLFSEGTATRPLFAGLQAKGDTGGAAGGGSLRAGVRLAAAEWQIEPSLSLAGVGLSERGLTETQAGPVGQSIGNASVGSLQTLLGVRVERRFALSETMSLVPSVQVGWLHEYLDTQAAIRASFIGAPGVAFGVQSASIGRDAAAVGVRAALDMNGPVSLYASYAGTLNGSSTAQAVTGGLRFVW